MKKYAILKMFLVASIVFAWNGLAENTGQEKKDAALEKKLAEYHTVTFQQLKAAPEDFKEKKVAYAGRFMGFTTRFFPYMEKSGFKSSRYYLLIVTGGDVPVMTKKTSEFKAIMAEIKPGTLVKVYGRIKKYRSKPVNTRHPRYYLRTDYIRIIQELPPAAKAEDPGMPKKHGRRKRNRRWLH